MSIYLSLGFRRFLEARKDVQLSKCDGRKKEIESQVRNLEGQKTSTDDRIQKLNKSLASTQVRKPLGEGGYNPVF